MYRDLDAQEIGADRVKKRLIWVILICCFT